MGQLRQLASLTLGLCHVILLAHGRDLSRQHSDSTLYGDAGGGEASLLDRHERDLSPEQEKRWNEFAVWGKRDPDLDGYGARDVDKRWKDMAVWGKREAEAALNKRWKDMAVWGKRLADADDKRWKNMAAWGKRYAEAADKRWKDMAVWGKRATDFNADLDKRWKDMAVWGKRNVDTEELKSDLEKRWKEMAVWGKRGDEQAKRWDEMAVWGKRSAEGGIPTVHITREQWDNILRRNPLLTGAKRISWSDTGFTSWGKRAAESEAPAGA